MMSVYTRFLCETEIFAVKLWNGLDTIKILRHFLNCVNINVKERVLRPLPFPSCKYSVSDSERMNVCERDSVCVRVRDDE